MSRAAGTSGHQVAGQVQRLASTRLLEPRSKLAITEELAELPMPLRESATGAPLQHSCHLSHGKATPGKPAAAANCRQIHHTAAGLAARLAEHEAGRGSRLLQVAEAAGNTWTLARTWPGGCQRERQLKNQGGASRRCGPACGVRPRSNPGE
jgi:hypothetical protein